MLASHSPRIVDCTHFSSLSNPLADRDTGLIIYGFGSMNLTIRTASLITIRMLTTCTYRRNQAWSHRWLRSYVVINHWKVYHKVNSFSQKLFGSTKTTKQSTCLDCRIEWYFSSFQFFVYWIFSFGYLVCPRPWSGSIDWAAHPLALLLIIYFTPSLLFEIRLAGVFV